jgi:hypothetical protein
MLRYIRSNNKRTNVNSRVSECVYAWNNNQNSISPSESGYSVHPKKSTEREKAATAAHMYEK